MPKVGYKNKVHNVQKPKIPKQKRKKPGPKVKRGPKTNGKNPKEKLPLNHKNINKNQKPIQKKTFPDYRGLSDKEFYEATAQWADMYDKKRMERYTKALAEVIIHELKFVGELRIPYIGMFSLQKYKAYDYVTKDFGSKPKKVHVPERKIPVFVPCDSLINDVNEEFRTKEYKRRESRGGLSWRDYTRELRHELFEAEEEVKKKDTKENQERVQELHEKFRQTLKCNDIRSLEKIIDISDKREEQFDKKNKYQNRNKEEINEDE